MKTERVDYRCDQYGNRASETAVHREGQWREIRFGYIDDDESDVRKKGLKPWDSSKEDDEADE